MGFVYLVGSTPELADALAAALAERPDVRLVVERDLPTRSRGVVVFGPQLPPDRAFAKAAALTSEQPDLPVLVLASSVSVSLMKLALRAGVRDVLGAKDDPSEIAEAVLAAHDGMTFAEPEGTGRVITVFGTKGGVGKSVIATNLAVALAQEGFRTVLVDLDLQFGDAAIMLQLPPDRTIRDVVRSFDKLDAEMLRGYLVEHPSGMLALLAPIAPEDAEWIEAAHVERILELLRTISDFVIVDMPPALDEIVLTALEHSDEVYAVATPDVPSIKNARIALQKLRQLGLAEGRVRLVLNRADSKVGLEPAEVRKATGCPVAARVPSDRLVPRSVNRGVPVVMDEPKSAVARSLVAMAQAIGRTAGQVDSDVA